MTLLSHTTAFANRLREIIADFRERELLIREQYKRQEAASNLPPDLLERATRRFLIDPLLHALDWNIDNPDQVAEEGRSWDENDERLYFDYLGLDRSRAPVFLVEAKGFDLALPHRPHEKFVDASHVVDIVAHAVDAMKRGDRSLPVISEWAHYLRDLRTYIASLDDLGQRTLSRAAITAGGWIIIFLDPVSTFLKDEVANRAQIICFASPEEMLERHDQLYKLLHRSRLVDTLPLVVTVSEALAMIPRTQIGVCFQAVLVATSTTSGAKRQQYPTRSIYPALLIASGNRWFAIMELTRPVEERKGQERISALLVELAEVGEELLERLRRSYRLPFIPAPVEQFPGFEKLIPADGLAVADGPVAGSTAHRLGAYDQQVFVWANREAGAQGEFIVVTGRDWFYKRDVPIGQNVETDTVCPYHFWKSARDRGVGADQPRVVYNAQSFTEDGQDRHCAHHDLLSLRAGRCHIKSVETYLCCRTCIFADTCWVTDQYSLPCPTLEDARSA